MHVRTYCIKPCVQMFLNSNIVGNRSDTQEQEMKVLRLWVETLSTFVSVSLCKYLSAMQTIPASGFMWLFTGSGPFNIEAWDNVCYKTVPLLGYLLSLLHRNVQKIETLWRLQSEASKREERGRNTHTHTHTHTEKEGGESCVWV